VAADSLLLGMLRSRVRSSPPSGAAAPADELPPAPDTLDEEVGTEATEDGGGAAGGAMVPTLDKGLSPTLSLTKLGFWVGILDDESSRF
jgi:hypothetical protein